MREDFLHYIWKYQNFVKFQLLSVNGESIEVIHPGHHNHNAGPDFFNAKIRIGEQLWAGNVEIHIKSSDWYAHHHEVDKAYDNVILHVVWENDSSIFRKDNTEIPTLVLSQYVDINLERNFKRLMTSRSWINCESDLADVDAFLMDNWLERLYINRLERKSHYIHQLLKSSQNDWEAVLFKMLLKNFGLKVNGRAFESLGNSVDYTIIRKLQPRALDVEALLFGQAKLLDQLSEVVYFKDLHERYQYVKKKFSLDNSAVVPASFFRLRPPNFPTIRLSQFANLYATKLNLFSSVLECTTKEDYYDIFSAGTSPFWQEHYTFTKSSKSNKRKLTRSFIDLLIINTVVPLKFTYAKTYGKIIEQDLLQLMKEISPENNRIFNRFSEIRTMTNNALTSQGVLELKLEYCDKNHCLDCSIGNSLILKK